MGKVTIPYKPRQVQIEIHELLDRHRFAVIVAHRRLGKTVAMVNQLIKRAVDDGKKMGIYGYVAPFLKQAKAIAWEYLKHFTGVIPGRKVNEQELWVELPNGSRIRIFGADNPDSLRGLYYDGVIMDEVAQMKLEVWGEIIRPALADRLGWAVFIGTPKGINLFYEMYERAKRDTSGEWAARLYTIDQTMKMEDPPLSADEVARLKDESSENIYRQEFLCDFTADNSNTFIEQSAVSEARNREKPMVNTAPLVLGLDVAWFGDDRTVLVARRGQVLEKIEMRRGQDLMDTADMTSAAIVTLNPRAVFVDSIGIGAGVVSRLRQLGHRVIDVNSGRKAPHPDQFVNLKAEMWGRMRDWLDTACIPDDQALQDDLLAPTYDYDSSGRLKIESKDDLKKRGLASTDIADALALTFAQPVAHTDLRARRPRFAEMD